MKKNLGFLCLGLSIGIVVGFLYANYNARSGGSAPSSVVPVPGTGSSTSEPEATLTNEEIEQKLAQAEKNPSDLKFQRELGLALYAYGASKSDAKIIERALVPLNRVLAGDVIDREVLVAVGNAHFDIGYIAGDDQSYSKAREFYEKALLVNADDAGVIVDVGLTYALSKTPDHKKAIEIYERGLKISPSHERTLQMMVQSQLAVGDLGAAKRYVDRLTVSNPKNPMLPEFEKQLAGR